MRRLVLALALTGLMSVTVLAGEIPTNDVVSPPASPPATATATQSDNTADLVQTGSEADTLWAEITMTLLQLLTLV